MNTTQMKETTIVVAIKSLPLFWEKQARQTTATISNGWTIVKEVVFQRCEKVLGQRYADQKNKFFCPGARQLKPLMAFR